MTVEKIKSAIIGEAEEEARSIEAEAGEAKKGRLEEGRRKIEAEVQKRFEEARKELEGDSERRIMQRRAKHKSRLLAKRNSILASVFEEAQTRLREQDDQEYRSMLSRWAEEIPNRAGGEVLCSESDLERIKPLVKAMNKERDADAELTLSADDSVKGGILFRSENFEVEMTVRSRLNGLREELVPEIAEVVFK